MGLEYRGQRVSEPDDIVRLLDVRAKASEVTDAGDVSDLITDRVSPLADRGYVDSAFEGSATQADVNNAYSDKVSQNDLGKSIMQLDGSGKIHPDLLPSLSTRGARWFSGGGVTPRTEVGDGGIFALTSSLSSLTVSGSQMGGGNYYALGFAQIETRARSGSSNPQIYIGTNSGFSSNIIAMGHGIPGWLDYHHVTVLPATNHNVASETFSGNTTFYLHCRTIGGLGDFGSFLSHWGILAIPKW